MRETECVSDLPFMTTGAARTTTPLCSYVVITVHENWNDGLTPVRGTQLDRTQTAYVCGTTQRYSKVRLDIRGTNLKYSHWSLRERSTRQFLLPLARDLTKSPLGTLLRWPVQDPRDTSTFHLEANRPVTRRRSGRTEGTVGIHSRYRKSRDSNGWRWNLTN